LFSSLRVYRIFLWSDAQCTFCIAVNHEYFAKFTTGGIQPCAIYDLRPDNDIVFANERCVSALTISIDQCAVFAAGCSPVSARLLHFQILAGQMDILSLFPMSLYVSSEVSSLYPVQCIRRCTSLPYINLQRSSVQLVAVCGSRFYCVFCALVLCIYQGNEYYGSLAKESTWQVYITC